VRPSIAESFSLFGEGHCNGGRFPVELPKYIIRFTDKSGIFHLGHATDYEQKAEAYRQKTGAYIELETDPLWPTFDKVVHLLNSLRSKDHIRAWQLNEMMPKRSKIALAYLYFIPKPHKVPNAHVVCYNMTVYVIYLFIGRHSTKTDCVINEYTNNWYFQVFRSINSAII
jgi:hypothetical protein